MEIDDILEEDLLSIFNVFEKNDSVKKEVSSARKVDKSIENEVDLLEEFDSIPKSETPQKSATKVLQIDSQNVESFAILLKELLNNKTIEISIKIKEN